MNKTQKEQIHRLRHDGLGYLKIAQTLGLSENTVKSYCKRNNLGGQMAVAASDPAVQTFCKQCGQPLAQNTGHKSRKFCSRVCRQEWWKAHPEQVMQKAVYTFTCAHCGVEFSAYGNSRRKYCSHACYIADRFGGEATQ